MGIVASASIETIVVQSFDDPAIDPREWDEFVVSLDGDLYMSFDWCRIWWRHFGHGRLLRIFIFRESGRLVGIAPMFIERPGLVSLGLRFGKRVGADHMLDLFSLPLANHIVEQAYAEILSTLVETERCNAVWIGFCPGNDPTLPGLRQAVMSFGGSATLLRDAEIGPHAVFELPATLDAYLGSLDAGQRKSYRRRLKQFMGQYCVTFDVTSGPPEIALQVFDEFREAHTRQWQAENKLGQFGDWPGSVAFNRDLVEALSRKDRFRLVRTKANDEVVHYTYAYVYGRRCFSRLPARSTQKEYDRFGLGVLGLVHLIEVMIGAGIRSIESGVGHYDHKVHFGAKEMSARSCVVVVKRHLSQLRYRIFRQVIRAIDILYYRIWYKRMTFRPRFLRRPLWEVWIRWRQ